MKPWPNDALIVVASLAVSECRERMTGVVEQSCRCCASTLHVDPDTIAAAMRHPTRRNRPVAYFCIACAVEHGPPDLAIDHRTDPAHEIPYPQFAMPT